MPRIQQPLDQNQLRYINHLLDFIYFLIRDDESPKPEAINCYGELKGIRDRGYFYHSERNFLNGFRNAYNASITISGLNTTHLAPTDYLNVKQSICEVVLLDLKYINSKIYRYHADAVN